MWSTVQHTSERGHLPLPDSCYTPDRHRLTPPCTSCHCLLRDLCALHTSCGFRIHQTICSGNGGQQRATTFEQTGQMPHSVFPFQDSRSNGGQSIHPPLHRWVIRRSAVWQLLTVSPPHHDLAHHIITSSLRRSNVASERNPQGEIE